MSDLVVLAFIILTGAIPIVLFVRSYRAGYSSRYLDLSSLIHCLELPLIVVAATLLVWLLGSGGWAEFVGAFQAAAVLALYQFVAYLIGVFAVRRTEATNDAM